MFRKIKTPLLAFGLFSAAIATHANPSPEGRWRTIDDKTGKPKSIVRLWVDKGELLGQIDSIFPGPDIDTDPKCDECPDDFKGKRTRSLHFLWGMKQDGEQWAGGKVLDPKIGKIYRCKIEVAPDNKSISVRGFIGVSLLGRSQKWERLED